MSSTFDEKKDIVLAALRLPYNPLEGMGEVTDAQLFECLVNLQYNKLEVDRLNEIRRSILVKPELTSEDKATVIAVEAQIEALGGGDALESLAMGSVKKLMQEITLSMGCKVR